MFLKQVTLVVGDIVILLLMKVFYDDNVPPETTGVLAALRV